MFATLPCHRGAQAQAQAQAHNAARTRGVRCAVCVVRCALCVPVLGERRRASVWSMALCARQAGLCLSDTCYCAQAPIALVASYCHPFEMLISNVLPLSLGMWLTHAHIFTMSIWTMFAVLGTQT